MGGSSDLAVLKVVLCYGGNIVRRVKELGDHGSV
jgi:hypothetical protein